MGVALRVQADARISTVSKARRALVIDLSSSGAAISVDYKPQIGEPLALGTALCRVVRQLDVGFAVQFLTPIDRDEVEAADIDALADARFAPEANYAI